MRILVLGGTKFFGRRLVRRLIDSGHDVTVATRALAPDDFGSTVHRLVVERRDPASMMAALGGTAFDLVYDQICSDPRDARVALDALGDRVGRYVFTSSMGVYAGKDGVIVEADFNAGRQGYDLEAPAYTFVEGKRQAEAYFTRHAPCPVVSARVAYVISDTDDPTGRLDDYVTRVAKGESVGVTAVDHPVSFATAWDTAACLAYLGTATDASGPVNVANGGHRSARTLTEEVASVMGVPARFHVGADGPDGPPLSPYAGMGLDWRLSNARATALGYAFSDIGDELPGIIAGSARRLGVGTTAG